MSQPQPAQAAPAAQPQPANARNTRPCLVCGRQVAIRDQHPADPLITYRCPENCGEYQASDLFHVAWNTIPAAGQQYLENWMANHRGTGKVLLDSQAGDNVNNPRFINWPVKVDAHQVRNMNLPQ